MVLELNRQTGDTIGLHVFCSDVHLFIYNEAESVADGEKSADRRGRFGEKIATFRFYYEGHKKALSLIIKLRRIV